MIAIINPLTSKKPTVFLILIFCSNIMLANENPILSAPDSLRQKSYNYLKQSFFKSRKDEGKSLIYAEAWLAKAKAENEPAQMSMAYKAFAYNCNDEKLKFAYIDSMVTVANHSTNNMIIGAAYLTKGIALYDNMEHQKALDNYMIADSYISKTSDRYQTFKVKYQIAQTKYQLGFYHEAIALLNECIPYFEIENDRAYLNSLYALSLCYNSIAKYNLSSQTNLVGQATAKELEILELLPYFSLSEALNEYGRKNYRNATAMIMKILPTFTIGVDKSNLAVAHFYLAKSYWALGQKESALPYLKKVDEVFNEQKYIRPDLLGSYELLIEYYKLTGDTKAQLYYMEKLMTADKKINQDYKYLSGKILRKYNSQKLRQEIQKISQSSRNQKVYGSGIIVTLSGTILFLFYRHRRTRKQYHLKFEELMKKNKSGNINNVATPIPYSESELGLSRELADALLAKLERFEKRHEYTESDMTLSKLAAKLNTNQKYVTKILAHYRGKGTIEYISDLKIDYIVQKLQTDKKFRNYKNKSLSDEAGFGSTQIFTRTFKAKIGMPPTIFISELRKKLLE